MYNVQFSLYLLAFILGIIFFIYEQYVDGNNSFDSYEIYVFDYLKKSLQYLSLPLNERVFVDVIPWQRISE